MTEPNRPRAVPGPPRPGPGPASGGVPAPTDPPAPGEPGPAAQQPFTDLEERPVADHVAVYEAEHSRLQRELGTIDRL
jgi:hypothetical protein